MTPTTLNPFSKRWKCLIRLFFIKIYFYDKYWCWILLVADFVFENILNASNHCNVWNDNNEWIIEMFECLDLNIWMFNLNVWSIYEHVFDKSHGFQILDNINCWIINLVEFQNFVYFGILKIFCGRIFATKANQ